MSDMEELLREMVSKICPLHGKKAIINLDKDSQIEIRACCKEFLNFLENVIKNRFQQENNRQTLRDQIEP